MKIGVKTKFWDREPEEKNAKIHTLFIVFATIMSMNFVIGVFEDNLVLMIINGLMVLQLMFIIYSYKKRNRQSSEISTKISGTYPPPEEKNERTATERATDKIKETSTNN